MKEKDIIADILTRASQAVREFVSSPEFMNTLNEAITQGGGLEQRIADQLAGQILAQDQSVRRQWACGNPYVPAKSPQQEEAKRQALDEVKKTGRVAEAASKYGVSRATLYRALGERGR